MTTYKLTGNLADSGGWYAVWFDVDDEGMVNTDTVTLEEVACWTTYQVREVKTMVTRVGGLVAGHMGLYLAEVEDKNFRGYVPPGDGMQKCVETLVKEFNEAVALAGQEEEEEEEEEDDDDEGDGD